MKVRPATVEDATAIATLSAQLGYPVSQAAMEERLATVLRRNDETVLVGHESGVVIGWIHGAEQRFLEADVRCELLGLVVDQGHRRKGVGQQLVRAVEWWARNRGIKEVSVRSNIVRPESHPFYERLGYGRTKTQHVYRKQL
jgi:GNAT superfamily N-acetyltransferase